MKRKLVIIGGGAAGLMAACAAGRTAKSKVQLIIVEARDRVGKKILATGNGRCNLTNLHMSPAFFHGLDCGCEQNTFVAPALSSFDTEKVMGFFASIGLMCRSEEGRVYPYCNQASAVLDVLRNEASRLGVITIACYAVQRITSQQNGFLVIGDDQEISADAVVIATGGRASPALGSDGSGYKLLMQMGHQITDLYPGLVQLKTDDPVVKGLRGIRFNGTVTLQEPQPLGRRIASAEGEMMFTDYGLTGIPVMEVSVFVHRQPVFAVIDFLPEYDLESLIRYLTQRAKFLSHLLMDDFLTGMLNKKLGQAVLKISGIQKLSLPVKALNIEQVNRIAEKLKYTTLRITGTNGFANAQVTVGGADLSGFSPYTMESKIKKGLFAAGEVLDVNGDCGGYNLHWAWASGHVAGKHAVLQI